MFKRKTRSQKVEHEELTRRLKAAELDTVALPSEPTRLEQARARETRRRASFPDPPADELYVCEKHGFRGKPGQPPPPASMCRDCLAEAGHPDRKPPRSEANAAQRVEVSQHPTGSERAEQLYARKLAERRANGEILPGTPEEDAALERIDGLRAEQNERDHPKLVYVSWDGKRVQYARRRRKPRQSWHTAADGSIVVEG